MNEQREHQVREAEKAEHETKEIYDHIASGAEEMS